MQGLSEITGALGALAQLSGGAADGDEEVGEENQMEDAKQNYDVFVQNTLDYTSHCVQWLPLFEQDPDHANFEFAHFLTGTHNDDDSNPNHVDHINLIKVRMPKLSATEKTTIDYSALDRNSHSKMQIVRKIPHEGEVFKCRQNPLGSEIASILTSGIVNVYSAESGNKLGGLVGLEEDSFCLDWNRTKSGLVVSAAGSTVCVWDCAHHLTQDTAQGSQALKISDAHGTKDVPVSDAKFSPHNDFYVLTSGGDGCYKIWDLRQGGSQSALQGQICAEALNVGTFNNVNENMFACAGEDCQVSVYDMRMPANHLNQMQFHEQEITSLEWHPSSEQICLSGSKDGKVYLWDNSKNGEEQAQGDYEDGPPELIFHHLSHVSEIEDISFCPKREGKESLFPAVVSVEMQLTMQIWKPKEDFMEEELDMLDNLNQVQLADLE